MAEEGDKLAALLSSLCRHIKGSNVSVEVERDHQQCFRENILGFAQATDELTASKLRWLRSTILYVEIKQLCLETDMGDSNTLGNQIDEQMSALLRNSLAFAEVGDYINIRGDKADCEASLLGITEEDLARLNPYSKQLHTLQSRVLPLLEERLRTRCETMLEFHNPTKRSSSNEELKFAQSAQLPAFVDCDRKKLDADRAALVKARIAQQEEFWATYDVILQSLAVMERLITEHKMKSNTEHNKAKNEWLVAKCDSLAGKIRVLELTTMCEMYRAETVNALHAIKRELDDATVRAEQENQRVTQMLNAYESVGLGFDELVTEYSNLKKELENKEWVLKEVNTTTG